jgi:hypothetical protein
VVLLLAAVGSSNASPREGEIGLRENVRSPIDESYVVERGDNEKLLGMIASSLAAIKENKAASEAVVQKKSPRRPPGNRSATEETATGTTTTTRARSRRGAAILQNSEAAILRSSEAALLRSSEAALLRSSEAALLRSSEAEHYFWAKGEKGWHKKQQPDPEVQQIIAQGVDSRKLQHMKPTRTATKRPAHKLSVGLIDTYNCINKVSSQSISVSLPTMCVLSSFFS